MKRSRTFIEGEVECFALLLDVARKDARNASPSVTAANSARIATAGASLVAVASAESQLTQCLATEGAAAPTQMMARPDEIKNVPLNCPSDQEVDGGRKQKNAAGAASQ